LYCTVLLGKITSIISPIFEFIKALPTGESLEILPSTGLAERVSSEPTICKVLFAFVSILSISTSSPTLTY